MFEPFLIVVFESINCPQCEKMDLKIIQSLLERVQICKNAGKLQNLQNVEDLSEEQLLSSTVQNKQGTHEQPTQNKKNSRGSSRVTSHVLRTKVPKLLKGVI